uniref:uncharacterized protein LOC122596717 n=1 Tax=Erigeron canadensis TaxID=72917 RepID=UPI001CB8EA96|nr:uncharacterized protein LOC122596717 [Erigeron canadensis]
MNLVEMIAELFTYPRDALNVNKNLSRARLKPLPRLIMNLISWNICPRSSDKGSIRLQEVVVSYALVTGKLNLSLRHIIMTNIWESRNKKVKLIIPYPRLITRLIFSHKAATIDSPTIPVNQVVVSMKKLLNGTEWALEDRPQCRILRDLKSMGRLIAPKDRLTLEEVEAQLELVGPMDVDEHGEPSGDNVWNEEELPRICAGVLDAGRGGNRPNVGIKRPNDYHRWTSFEKSMWDLAAQQTEEARVRRQEQKDYKQAMAYAHELEIRRRFQYTEVVRHDEEKHLAYPQSHDSEWLPQQSCVGRMETGPSDPPASSSAASSSTAAHDSFDGQSLYRSLMESIFRPPQGLRQ